MKKVRKVRKQSVKAEQGERRCFMTGLPAAKENLIRFVVGPDKLVYPDVGGKLDGRGVWMTASKALLQQAIDKKMFSKAFHLDVKPVPDLAPMVADLLEKHCLHTLGLANKGGFVVSGFDKVKDAAHKENLAVLVEAADGAADGREKLQRLVPDAFFVNDWASDALSRVLGRDFCVHIAIKSGKMAHNFKNEVMRLRRFNEIKKEDS